MLSWVGLWEILLVLGLLLLFFGGRKIPQIARGLGSGIRNLKGEIARDEGGESGPGGDGELGRDPGPGREVASGPDERGFPGRAAGGAEAPDRTGGSDDGPGPTPAGGSPRPS